MSYAAAVPVFTDKQSRLVLRGHPNRTFLMRENADGVITLEPAVVISELEKRYLANASLQTQIAEAREHPERSRPRPKRPTD
jgi:hypothetical protein